MADAIDAINTVNQAIQGLTATISSYSSRDFNMEETRSLMDKSLQQQKDYYDYTFDKNAQYNHPSEQMARLKQAGLNPNLLYGQVQNAASGQSGGGSIPSVNQRIQSYDAGLAEAIGLQMNREHLKSQIDYQKSVTLRNNLENRYLARYYGDDNLAKLLGYEMDKKQLENDNMASDLNLKALDATLKVANEKNINSQTALNVINGVSAGLKPMQIYQEIKESNSRISLNKFNTIYLTALASQANANTEQIKILNKYAPRLNESQIKKIAQEIQTSRNSSGVFTGLANRIDDVIKMINSWFE